MPAKLTKVCQCCRQTKALDDFFHNRTKPDFHNGICKTCQKTVNQQRTKS